MNAGAVKDVSSATFEAEVLDASFERPVVVDFWAPWCGPCRMLGPVLERLAASANGAWTLAKLNVDEAQDLARRYGVQGIPAVKGFRDGRVAAEFVGAQPEARVRRFLEGLLPTAADLAVKEGERLLDAGQPGAAEAAFRQALAQKADHPRALLGLGRALAEADRVAEAVETLALLPPNTPERREAAPLLARLRLAGDGEGQAAMQEAERVLHENPHDPEANLVLGQALAARGDFGGALPRLLAVVERDKAFRDGAARTAMLAIFDALGSDHPLVAEYRRKLASALYV